MTILALDALALDEELQPRAAIDRSVLENYVQLLVDGVQFPPVVAFRDRGPIANGEMDVLWLADGFHRWHAHKVIDADGIEADIREGDRREALLYSLAANAKHGLQRGATDYRRAYDIVCRNGLLVDPTDSEAVAALLHCSGRWATDLTAKARDAARAARAAQIVQLRDEGLSNREVARETGVPETTVRRVLAPKQRSSETADETPFLNDIAKEKLRRLETPAALNWSAALRALRHVNEQVPVDELFADRFDGFDHVVGPQLETAFAWIGELRRRFVNDKTKRRRA